MKCLRTGCYLKVDNTIFHCDMYADEDNFNLVFKGFARDSTEFKSCYDVEILDNATIQFSDNFMKFMLEWNQSYLHCLKWNYVIEDQWNQFKENKWIFIIK